MAMKNYILIVLLLLFYCIPQQGGYFCREPDFFIQNIQGKLYKCYENKEKPTAFSCDSFDNGAILMEPQHMCPDLPRYWFNSAPSLLFTGGEN